jgi:pimeloyl-ACP methyl ester carboxylesterase
MRFMARDGMFVEVGGVEQWVTLRGEDSRNPVLLVVSGPGVALSQMTPFFAPWEKSFTLVQWDQPGAGSTQAKNAEAGIGPISIDRIVRDGIVVADFVRKKLGAAKIAVLALSGGTIVGLEMVKTRPELFFAYVGSGQVVNWSHQQRASYAMVLERARRSGDGPAIAELEAIGPPPYLDTATDAVHSKYASALTPAEQEVFATLDPAVLAAMRRPPEDATYVAKGLTLPDQRAQATATYDELRGEILAFDARSLGLEFDVPMVFVQGEDDAYTPTPEVEKYANEIEAPVKAFVRIEGGGHSCFFLRQPFLDALEQNVRSTPSSWS